MPYIVSFMATIIVTDRAQYINDCCIGGDILLAHLLPSLRRRYGGELQSVQEDWGWFVWFAAAGTNLAIDVQTHDADAGKFQIHLTSRKPRFLLQAKIQDTPELESLRDLVTSELRRWEVAALEVEHVDERYRPVRTSLAP